MGDHPTRIGPYLLRDVIGRGGMGIVYRVEYVETGQTFALKTLGKLRARMMESIRREAHTLSRIRHPGIVQLVGYGIHEGLPWYAMELLEGQTLHRQLQALWSSRTQGAADSTLGLSLDATEHMDDAATPAATSSSRSHEPASAQQPIAAGGHLPRALTLICRLCQTLAYLHGEGLVHRDLKPDNIVVREGDVPVIVDFGIARRFAGATGREALEVDHSIAGTPDFMAPEQLQGRDIDARTDLYALGCILFIALCGRPPFVDRSGLSVPLQHLTMAPPRPSSFVAGVPPELDALVLRLLDKEPSARPGYADDVAAALVELGGHPSPLLAEPPPRAYLYRPPFTGQAELLRFLEEELECAREGRGRCVIVSGPSGSGKTRLATEVARAASRAGMLVLSGECTPFGMPESDSAGAQSAPLQAFAALLRQAAAHCRLNGPEATRHLFGASCRVLEEHEPSLATVPGHEDYEPPPHLSPLDAGERAQRCVVDLLAAYAALTSLLLIVDDAQWADDLSLGALKILANGPPAPLRALVLVTCRSESRRVEIDALRSAQRACSLHLEPLGSEDVGRIAAGMTAIEEMPPPFQAFLAEQSGGTPFFVAEYLNAAVAKGLMIRREGQWRLLQSPAKGASGIAMSASGALEALRALGSVDALLARRLDGLGPVAHALLEAGAVLGRQWEEHLAATVAGVDAERIPEAIDELLSRHILMEAEGDALRFAHDKIRETAYAAIAAGERRELHRRAAEAIEAREHGAGAYGILARHYRLASVPGKAFFYAEHAGRHALEVGAFREACEHLEAALELADAAASGIALSPLERGQLLRRLGDALYGRGDIENMGRRMMEAVDAMGLVTLPRSGAGWAALLMDQTRKQVALRWLPPGWTRASVARRDVMAASAYALERLGELHVYRDQPLQYLATKLLAANLAEQADAPVSLAWVQVNMAVALTAAGLRGLAQRYLERSRHHGRRSGDLDTELYQQEIEGFVWFLHCDWDTAQQVLDAALERSRTAGAAYRIEQLLIVSSLNRYLRGDLQGSIEHAGMLRDSAAAAAREFHQASGHLNLGSGLVACGRFDEALDALAAADALLRGANVEVLRAICRATMAGAHLGRGDIEAAVRDAVMARALLRRPPETNMAADQFHRYVPAVHLAAWARARERREPTKDAERRAVQAVRSATRYAWLFRTGRACALRHRALAARLRERYVESRQLLTRSTRVAAALRMPHDEACSWLELGRAPAASVLERSAALDRAAALFHTLGCERFAEQARQARASLHQEHGQ